MYYCKGFLTSFSVLVYLGVLNAIVFGMDKETLSRLNWSQMRVRPILSYTVPVLKTLNNRVIEFPQVCTTLPKS